jgi:2-polyprenyl-6-methoxyphenol hydroxylase-like FAD-dependent oxidoreductase
VERDGSLSEGATLEMFQAKKIVGADGYHSIVRSRLAELLPPERGGIPENLDLSRREPDGDLEDVRMIATVRFKDPKQAKFYQGWTTRVKTAHSNKVYVWGGKETTELGVGFPRTLSFSSNPVERARQQERYFWSALKSTGISENDCEVTIKPVVFTQRPMSVRSVTDPRHASFFLVGDAVRGGHAASSAGAQLALIDGARVAQSWVMESQGRSPEEVARFYQRGTLAATRGLLRKSLPHFPATPTTAEMQDVAKAESLPHVNVRTLWKNRSQLAVNPAPIAHPEQPKPSQRTSSPPSGARSMGASPAFRTRAPAH